MAQKNSAFYNWYTLTAAFFLLSFSFNALSFPPPAMASKKSPEKNYVEGEVIGKISVDESIGTFAQKYALSATLFRTSPKGNSYILRSETGLTTKDILRLVEHDPLIKSVQPNFKYKPLVRNPNDHEFYRQWALNDAGLTPGGISAPSAWDFEAPKKNKVPIAIIDTGISYSNPEIKSNITGGSAKGRDINNPKKKPIDYDGHGTLLAGIIAAKTNNKKGIAGASFFGNIKIMPLKFDFTTTEAISALNYAKVRNIPIINASWGGYGEEGMDLALRDAIASYPGIFVTAAGNGNDDTGLGFDHDAGIPSQNMYPCDFDLANILCVAASDKNGRLADYSDYGSLSVDIAAPGGTDSDPIVGLGLRKNKFSSAEGTSLAAAFVTAEAGLIKSQFLNLSNLQIIEIIKNSVDTDPSLSGKVLTGGKINFQKAMQAAATY